MTNNNDDYKVGYGRPPTKHQFQPGKSGNPKGRPKGTKNLKTDLQEVLNEKVQVNAGGQKLTVSKQRAMVMRVCELALQGNVRSIELLTRLVLQHQDDDQSNAADEPLSKEDERILNDILQQREAISNQEDYSS